MTDSHRSLLSLLKRHKYAAILSTGALIAFLAWPTTTVQSPMWQVWVVNEAGQPLEGMTVRLTYRAAYSVDVRTNEKGYVVFRPQTLSVRRIQRIFTTIQAAMAGGHASPGPHAWVWTFGNGLEGVAESHGHVTDWNGVPSQMASRIVAKHGEALIRTL